MRKEDPRGRVLYLYSNGIGRDFLRLIWAGAAPPAAKWRATGNFLRWEKTEICPLTLGNENEMGMESVKGNGGTCFETVIERSPSKTWIKTTGWLSAAVEKI